MHNPRYSDYLDEELKKIDEIKENNRINTTKEYLSFIIETLKAFEGNYGKKLNLSKLANYLGISDNKMNEILSLIFSFQDLFKDTFSSHKLRLKRNKSKLYLITESERNARSVKNSRKKSSNHQSNDELKRISLSQNEIALLNDIIYTFKNINRGKGFDIYTNNTDFIRELNLLFKNHPYLFKKNGNGLVYPSKIGLELGSTINSYYKCNRSIETLKIRNYSFEVNNIL